MLTQFRHHWIDVSRIESVIEGASHSMPRSVIRFQSGHTLEVDGRASDVVDQIWTAWKAANDKLRPPPPPADGWAGQTSASLLRD